MKQALRYLAIGALSFLVVAILETLAAGLEGHLLRTEIYSIHSFSHVFFGLGLASLILFLRPRSTARVMMFAVLVVAVAWELYEGKTTRQWIEMPRLILSSDWEDCANRRTGKQAPRARMFCIGLADSRRVQAYSSDIRSGVLGGRIG